MIQVDPILREHGTDSEEKLDHVPPQTLGKWLGVDALVYGESFITKLPYALLIWLRRWEPTVRMVSTRSGEGALCGQRQSV
jgi:hypothetical protein